MATFKQYKTTKGTFWEFRINYKDPLTQEHRNVRRRQFATKQEAKFEAEAMERNLKEGFTLENTLLKDFIIYWLETHKKAELRISTYENKQQQIRTHILPYFQNIMLKDITHKFYQSFIDQMDEKGYSRSTISNNHWILNEMFERAIFEKKIKFNPAEKATIKGKERHEEDLEYIPSASVPELLKEAYKHSFEYYIFFKTLIDTGMRKGEAAALTWKDIDYDNNMIFITKTLELQSKRTGKTKTRSSKRAIKVRPSLIEELKKLRKRQAENMLVWGEEYDREANLIFCREKGQPLAKSTLFNAFRRYQKKTDIIAGLDENKEPVYFSIHALRHTHAVMCLEKGMRMKALQERLGHGAYEVTANVYSHVSPEMRDEDMLLYVEGTAELFEPVGIDDIFSNEIQGGLNDGVNKTNSIRKMASKDLN